METATITFAPLAGDSKSVPQRGEVPTAILEAETPPPPPTVMQKYGLVIYGIICYFIAAALILPLLKTKYRYLTDPIVYNQVYFLYFVFCIVILYVVWLPYFHIPAPSAWDSIISIIKLLFVAT
jgi:hypothetical protein